MSREHVPAIGEVIYLRHQPDPHCVSYSFGTYQGDTGRSWLLGHERNPNRYAKKDYTPCSKEERDEWAWALNHRYPISKKVYALLDPAILRQIAALVGYEEPRP